MRHACAVHVAAGTTSAAIGQQHRAWCAAHHDRRTGGLAADVICKLHLSRASSVGGVSVQRAAMPSAVAAPGSDPNIPNSQSWRSGAHRTAQTLLQQMPMRPPLLCQSALCLNLQSLLTSMYLSSQTFASTHCQATCLIFHCCPCVLWVSPVQTAYETAELQ